MGNSSSKKQKKLQSLAGDSSDLEYRDCSPWRRGRSELGDDGDCPLYDVPGKPSKAIVSLTNLQSDKAVGSCVTDSIYLDWYRPPTDGGRPIIGYTVEMYDLPTGLQTVCLSVCNFWKIIFNKIKICARSFQSVICNVRSFAVLQSE